MQTDPVLSEPSSIAPAGAPDALVDLNVAGTGTPGLTVVVPTRGEKDTVGLLLARLGRAVAPLGAEVVVVDDSDDETPGVLAEKAGGCPVPVRLLHRSPGSRKGGLGGAVIAGARHARGDWVLVMDADLQHPPEAAAVLASTAMLHDCDIVVGTRYAGDRSGAGGLGGAGRVMVSSCATRLVKDLFPRRLAMVSDPLSGLFAFRRASVDLGRLRPAGFKVLLEILVRNPVARVAEVAYRFEPRAAGESKASLRQGAMFLRHVARLRAGRLAGQLREHPVTRRERVGQAVRFVLFGLIGATGIVVNSAALWFFYHTLGWNHLIGAALATQASTTWNFALVDTIIYRKRAHGTRLGRAARFFLMNNVLLLARLPVFQVLIDRGLSVLVANGITLVLLFAVRFVVSDRAIFAPAGQGPRRDPVRVLVDLAGPDGSGPGGLACAARKRSRYLTYRYDVAGVVTIGSQVMLPELEFFRAQHIADGDVDIAVRVGDVGSRGPRRRAAMIESVHPTVIRYEEHFGRLGANFRARIDERITVDVGPLLARSSHVVYTNILEPLLRFVMVSRGRMLLHSACVELDGTGVMLSALTDTGKTGTVLRLLREHGGRFLSDDMTVIDRDGNASWFPKPLTISAHTLRAVSAEDLTRSEWRRLQIQSRLHSRGGRSFAMALSGFNLPIMGINALTQMLVPPPKYTVDRLVPCQITDATRVRELFIIERGSPRLADLDKHEALTRLLANTDDAYGFPPFRYLAPAITIGARDYHELRAAERDILAGFLANVRVRTLASDTFSWADEIPRLLEASEPRSAGTSGNGASDSFSWADESPHLIQAADSRLPQVSGNGASDNGASGSSAAGNGAGTPRTAAPPDLEGVHLGNGVKPHGGPEQVGSADTGNGSGPTPDPVVAPSRPPTPTTGSPRPFLSRLLYPGLPLAAVMALSVFLRFWQLGAVGFNSDEAVYSGTAASLAGDQRLAQFFPVFRAHPMMLQTILSWVFRTGVSDVKGRAVVVVFGLATIWVTYLLGRLLYNQVVGLAAAAFMAVMPYAVVVSREVLLDGPATLFATAALYCAARYCRDQQPPWLYAAAATMGLAILTKETCVILLAGEALYLLGARDVRPSLRQTAVAGAVLVAVMAGWWGALALSGRAGTGGQYALWQFLRRQNHPIYFYVTTLPTSLGYVLLALAIVGICWQRNRGWREGLLLWWVGAAVLTYSLLPIKGFQYLEPIAPVLAIWAALAIDLARDRLAGKISAARLGAATAACAAIVCVTMAVPTWQTINPSASTTFLAGSGGLPGGREAGRWIAASLPQGATILTIGPSMANVLEFYGNRRAYALAVSPNNRNPSYVPIYNPDAELRQGAIQYLVWDSFSAARSQAFGLKVLSYVAKFRAVLIHTQYATTTSHGHVVSVPIIRVYEVVRT